MPKSISFIFVLLFSSLRWPASFCINASVANWSASMAPEIIVAHLWVAAVSGRACARRVCYSLWKQMLLVLGQRARQPAYLGAHRELLNCSRTFLGPQRLFRARSDDSIRARFLQVAGFASEE